ncbi:uncharacterized protein LOC106655155 [Trichogramma pretiosum]|uniref:uncharacterized protein LOC106655155 n=1 Tax=Trichogramma pretiosum TaxID=7493 RepID=UPI0006C9AC76|nr:uncharacterized protein LOC106655155 [Trichogramma pretiosum]
MDNSKKGASNVPAEEEDDPDMDYWATTPNLHQAMYESQILDQQHRIERLLLRNEYLEKFCTNVNKDSENQAHEAENVVVELNVEIASERKKINDRKKKYEELCQNIDEEKSAHLKTVKRLEQSFELTRRQHLAKIRNSTAKVNAIEHFKLNEKYLRDKYNKQNQLLSYNKDEINRILESMKQKSILHKENLQKEALAQVLFLSVKFQQNLKNVISPTVQRLMRENIVLESEKVQLGNDYFLMKETQTKQRNSALNSKKSTRIDKSNITKRLKTGKLQLTLLEKLQRVESKIKDVLSKTFTPSAAFEEDYLIILKNLQNPESMGYKHRRRNLEVLLHQEKIKLTLAKQWKIRTMSVLNKYNNCMHQIKSIINGAISVNYTNFNDFKDMDFNALAIYLLSIIENCKYFNSCQLTNSVETIADVSRVYVDDDLGFEPEHVDLNYEILQKAQNKKNSELNNFDILEELRLLQDAQTKNSSTENSLSLGKSTSDEEKILRKSFGIEAKLYQFSSDEIFLDYEEHELEYDFQDEIDYIN